MIKPKPMLKDIKNFVMNTPEKSRGLITILTSVCLDLSIWVSAEGPLVRATSLKEAALH
jgi:hypothetical protein